jgi:hypothetical protein
MAARAEVLIRSLGAPATYVTAQGVTSTYAVVLRRATPLLPGMSTTLAQIQITADLIAADVPDPARGDRIHSVGHTYLVDSVAERGQDVLRVLVTEIES